MPEGPEHAVLVPAPGGDGLDVTDVHRPARALEPADERVVLEERLRREPAQARVHRAPDEERRIAIVDAQNAATDIIQPGEEPTHARCPAARTGERSCLRRRAGPCKTRSIDSLASAGSSVSACRNRNTSPEARAAPAASCWPRPCASWSTTAPSARAMATVRSVLPPSETTTSSAMSRAAATARPIPRLLLPGGDDRREPHRCCFLSLFFGRRVRSRFRPLRCWMSGDEPFRGTPSLIRTSRTASFSSFQR